MKKLQLSIKLSLVTAIVAIGLNGCSGKTAVRNVPLSLNYNLNKSTVQKTGKTIIILSSKSEMDELRANKRQRRDSSNPLSKMIAKKIAQSMGEIEGCDFDSIYYEEYEKKFLVSLKSKLADIVESKGFLTVSDYKTFEEIPYKNRKQSYLLIYPEIILTFSSNKLDTSKTGSKYTEKGQMALNAVVKLHYLEPLSKEKIDTLNINLSDIGIQSDYVCQQDFEQNHGSSAFGMGYSLGSKIGEALFSNKEADTTRVNISEALNKLFPIIMEEINKKIHREDFLAYSHDINEIKNKKRY